MNKLRLLIVEDREQDIDSFRDDLEDYKSNTERDIDPIVCKTSEDALEKLDSSIDGAIIDLRLGNQGGAGNQFIKEIERSFFRIPIFIFTANRSDIDDSLEGVKVFIKGDIGYYELLDRFWDIYETGLTHIMGSRGEMEKLLSEVFKKNIFPQIDKWIEHSKQDEQDNTQRALMRYTLSHLFHLLDEDQERFFPEEFYLYPPMSEGIKTGSIVKENVSKQLFVVLSPACDLVIRGDDGFKTDQILLVKIEQENNIVDDALDGIVRRRRKEDKLKAVFNNNHRDYYHWLPEAYSFDGGFLNFRKLGTLDEKKFNKEFGKPLIQISPPFVKDIVSRFSSFYARQGQPDIESKDFVTRHLDRTTNTA